MKVLHHGRVIVALGMLISGSGCFDFSAYPFGEEDHYCWNDRRCDAGLFCNSDKLCVNPCNDVDCSGNGTCVVNVDEGASCVCNSGYVVTDRVSCVTSTGQLGYPCASDETCAEGLACRDNVCYSDTCTPSPHSEQHCFDGNLTWYDSCGSRESVARHCGGNGCSSDHCLGPVWTELRLSASEPDISEQEESEIYNIALTMDGADQVYVAWTAPRGDLESLSHGSGVFVRYWSPGTGWTTLGPSISDTTYTNFAYYAEVTVLAGNGRVLRATRANDADNGSHTVISVDRWTGAAWEHEYFQPSAGVYQIPFDPQLPDLYASKPQLAKNETGEVVLVWNEWDNNFDPNADFNALYVARRSNVAGWSPYSEGNASGSGAVGLQETRQYAPRAAVGPNGEVFLLWTVFVSGRRTVQIYRETAGSWLPPSGSSGQIATLNGDDGDARGVVDSRGRLYLAWTHESAGGLTQFVARLDPDGTINEVGAGSMSQPGLSPSILRNFSPWIGLDAAEYPILVWSEEGRPQAKRWDGLEWRNYGQRGSTDVLGDQLPPGALVNTFEVAVGGHRLCLAWANVLSTPATPPSLRVTCTAPEL